MKPRHKKKKKHAVCSLLAEVSRHVGLPEAVQGEEPLGQPPGGRYVGPPAAVGEGVAALQNQPVAEVLVRLRVRRQTGLVPAERVRGVKAGGK